MTEKMIFKHFKGRKKNFRQIPVQSGYAICPRDSVTPQFSDSIEAKN